MKHLKKLLILSCCISNAFAQECIVPRNDTCMMSPGAGQAHTYVKINFKKNISKQIVYLERTCKVTEKFTPLNYSKNLYDSTSGRELILTLCVDGEFINKEIMETQSTDTTIVCNYETKLVCKKHEKKKSFWDKLAISCAVLSAL